MKCNRGFPITLGIGGIDLKSKKVNLYYMKDGQPNGNLISEREEKKKKNEREKRVRQSKKKEENDFNSDLDAAINMINKNKTKREKIEKEKITKEERRRKKRRKKIKKILSILLILGLIAGGTTFAMVSPIFNIQEIEVLENDNVATDEIISLSGLKKDENIFRFFSSQVIKNIKENPYVENVKINRKLPNKIQIIVEERKAKFCINFLGTYAHINTQGYILKITEDKKDLPMIKGIITDENKIIAGERLEKEDLEKLEDILKITYAFEENNLYDKIESIDISKKSDYSVILKDEKKEIYFGDSNNISNKILYILAIMEQEKGKEGIIYVNGDFNNKFQPFFREKV